jgi:osmotically-inducible protein OsmY
MKHLLSVLLAAALLQGCAPLIIGAAAVGTVAVIDDNRTTGTVIDDKGVTLKIANAFRNDDLLSEQIHINVNSFNGVVLLTGEAPSEEHKRRAEKISYDMPKVRQVVNEVRIAPPSSVASRSSDSWITSKVKSKLFVNEDVHSNRMKIVTEAQTVYLMGLVTIDEAERATEIARHTSRVQHVVRMFEYIEEHPR